MIVGGRCATSITICRRRSSAGCRRVAADEFAGLPRIYALALELIRHSAGRLDAQRLHRFITRVPVDDAADDGRAVGLAERAQARAGGASAARADILAASRAQRLLADRLAASLERAAQAATPGPPTCTPPSSSGCCSVRASTGPRAAALRHELDAALAARGQTVEDAIRAEGRHQAAEQAFMANLIGSLRLVSTFDWSEFFESVSLVEQVLQRDPAGVYGRMDFRSRDRYRHAVEEMAEPTGEAQVRVALKSVERARQVAERTPDARERARRLLPDRRRPPAVRAGHRLGSRALRRASAARSSVTRRPATSARSRSAPRRSSRAAVVYARAHGWRGADAGLVVALLTLVPASELTIQIVQRLIATLIPPRRLPRLDLVARSRRSARTMVIVPTILDSVERARELVEHLEVQALGNLDPHIHFAHPQRLPGRRRPKRCRATRRFSPRRAPASTRSTRSTATATRDRFFLFHRLAPVERAGRPVDGLGAQARQDRGVQSPAARRHRHQLRRAWSAISTILPRGAVLHHARQRHPAAARRGARADRHHHASAEPGRRSIRRLGRVTEGYGILQPRVSVTFASAAGSLFARLYAGHTGVDPVHHRGVRHLPGSVRRRDLHRQGPVRRRRLHRGARGLGAGERAAVARPVRRAARARRARLRRRAGRRVSLERARPRAAAASLDPRRLADPRCGCSRSCRRGADCKRNTLPLIARWKILDNLRRSLVAPTLLALLVAGWTRAARRALVLDAAVARRCWRRSSCRLSPRCSSGPRRAQSIPVFWRDLRRDTRPSRSRRSCSASRSWPTTHGTPLHAIVLTLVRAVVTGAGCSSGRRRGRGGPRAAGSSAGRRCPVRRPR